MLNTSTQNMFSVSAPHSWRHRGSHAPHTHTAHPHRSPLIVVQGDAISVLRERVKAASVSHIVLSYPGMYTMLYRLYLAAYNSIEYLSICIHTAVSTYSGIHTVVLTTNAPILLPSPSSPSSSFSRAPRPGGPCVVKGIFRKCTPGLRDWGDTLCCDRSGECVYHRIPAS